MSLDVGMAHGDRVGVPIPPTRLVFSRKPESRRERVRCTSGTDPEFGPLRAR